MPESDRDSNSESKVTAGAASVVSQVLQIAGDNPQVKEAGANIGSALLTVTRTVNHLLLPLAALNYGVDRAKNYFQERFTKELEEKTKHIPPDQIVEPKASLAGPALNGLAFDHDEPDLKAMYLGLLTTAMDGRQPGKAHRAFVEIIKQIESRELGFLRPILTRPGYLSIVAIHVSPKGAAGSNLLRKHYMDLGLLTGTSGPDEPGLAAFVENWIRLGLVEVDYTREMAQPNAYHWLDSNLYFNTLREFHERNTGPLTCLRGIIGRTNFGAQFASAVGMYESSHD